jgi:hypothetical protein
VKHAAVAVACAALLAVAPIARSQDAACATSPSRTFSSDTHLSPRAGGACLTIVTVYDGAACEPARRSWSAELGCSESRRIRVTDRGRLVSILAPRARNPLWPILRIFTPDGDAVRRTSLRLRDVPGTAGLVGRVTMTFEGASVVMASRDARASLTLDVVETLTAD